MNAMQSFLSMKAIYRKEQEVSSRKTLITLKNESSKMPKTMQFFALKCKLRNAPPKNQNAKIIFV
jgi:hypothetical protein